MRTASSWDFGWLPRLSRDGWLVFVTTGVRNFAYGFVSVILGLYLASLGLEAATIGVIFTAALAGGALMTVVMTQVADRLGRRRMLVIGALLMALGGGLFAFTDHVLVLIVAAILSTISPREKDVGPFHALEQAILPQTTNDERRTQAFAAYNLIGSLASASGALVIGLLGLFDLSPLAGYRALLLAYAATGLLLVVLFGGLSPTIEVKARADEAAGPQSWLGIHRSRGLVFKLAALFAVDSFAGGFVVQSLVAYWFHLRFGVETAALGGIFFGTNLASAISFLAAPALARKIGLLNTMVFTHLPSNVLLMLVPLMPTLELAIAMLLARHLLAQLDVPTRQSYTMAIVDPDERSAAAGLTSVARNAAAAIAPGFAGITLAVPALGLPFLVSGGLKIVYDLSIFALFRGVRPPEEARQAAGAVGLRTAAAEGRGPEPREGSDEVGHP